MAKRRDEWVTTWDPEVEEEESIALHKFGSFEMNPCRDADSEEFGPALTACAEDDPRIVIWTVYGRYRSGEEMSAKGISPSCYYRKHVDCATARCPCSCHEEAK